jgi:hypothetical protein
MHLNAKTFSIAKDLEHEAEYDIDDAGKGWLVVPAREVQRIAEEHGALTAVVRDIAFSIGMKVAD